MCPLVGSIDRAELRAALADNGTAAAVMEVKTVGHKLWFQ